MNLDRIQSTGTGVVFAYFVDGSSPPAPVTGLSATVRIFRRDAQFWQLAGGYSPFVADLPMTEIDAVVAPGWYYYDFDASAGGGASEEPHAFLADAGSDSVANRRQPGQVIPGQYVDDIDAAVSSRAEASVMSAGFTSVLNLDNANTTAVLNAVAALNDLDDAAVGAAVWGALLASHQTADTFGRALLRVLAHAAGRNRVVRGNPWQQEVYHPDDVPTLGGTLEDSYDLKDLAGAEIRDDNSNNPSDDPTVEIGERDEP